jgi:hypothetical protein
MAKTTKKWTSAEIAGDSEQSPQSPAALAKKKVKAHLKTVLQKLRMRHQSAGTKRNPER